ncbi:MAG TPA: HisA/HisF-related TIM barrel protein, partial [Clostridiales bacterium]|nr:HisA/HisF-related TIM barrel protein [Clostridiales bacterium]
LISEAAARFGSEKIVCAVDAKRVGDGWRVLVSGGEVDTGLDALEWSKRLAGLGAGEILLTSLDRDGSKQGYDLELTRAVALACGLPVIASGGAGKPEDFYDALTYGMAEGALAASLFHFGEVRIPQLKEYLIEKGLGIRPVK